MGNVKDSILGVMMTIFHGLYVRGVMDGVCSWDANCNGLLGLSGVTSWVSLG